jgi:hypothetical protein
MAALVATRSLNSEDHKQDHTPASAHCLELELLWSAATFITVTAPLERNCSCIPGGEAQGVASSCALLRRTPP